MFDRISGRYDMMNRLISLGMDLSWRRHAIEKVGVGPGTRVLDLACGTGDFALEAIKRGAHVVGVDFAARMLTEAVARGLGGHLVRGDALKLPLRNGSFDVMVTGFALRNFTDIAPVMVECARVIRPGGRIALLEVDTPRHPVIRLGHQIYFRRIVPLMGWVLSEREAYEYLPTSVAYLPDEEQLLRIVREAGFDSVSKESLLMGGIQLVTATRA